MIKTGWKYVQLCGYVGHPNAKKNGVILEHRLVLSTHLGRPLDRKEFVHHINGDKADNRLSNLQLITPSAHAKQHHSTGRSLVERVCAACGTTFFRERRQVVYKNPKHRLYCSRKCSHLGLRK